MGEYECDDGNRADFDGCSGECRVEEGFRCQGGNPTQKDNCKDIKSPTLSVSLTPTDTYKYIFGFDFSEDVRLISNNNWKSLVNLTITGKLEKYLFDYDVLFNDEGTVTSGNTRQLDVLYTGVFITLIPKSSIMEGDVGSSNIYLYLYSFLLYSSILMFSLMLMIMYYMELQFL